MAVGAYRNQVYRCVDFVAAVDFGQSHEMMNMNEAFAQSSIGPLEVEATCRAVIPVMP